jgi:hypothetical protein
MPGRELDQAAIAAQRKMVGRSIAFVLDTFPMALQHFEDACGCLASRCLAELQDELERSFWAQSASSGASSFDVKPGIAPDALENRPAPDALRTHAPAPSLGCSMTITNNRLGARQ